MELLCYIFCYVSDFAVDMHYFQAYYSLVLVAKMKQGQRVMIHAGWTNIGQAAIALAVNYGCTVFTTVANQEQRAFIRCQFPQVSVICNLVIKGNSRRCPTPFLIVYVLT
jgi:NADPH:quinone reductase-like Zn-dependent oxidoreductase